MGVFGRLVQRLRQDAASHRSASIREWCETQPGITLVAQTEPRSLTRVAGVVDALRVRTGKGIPQIEARISDGTGSVTAIWLGRRSIHGLALGVRIIIEGRVGVQKGRLQILNPAFEFGYRSTEE